MSIQLVSEAFLFTGYFAYFKVRLKWELLLINVTKKVLFLLITVQISPTSKSKCFQYSEEL